jgi:hypothetical protein
MSLKRVTKNRVKYFSSRLDFYFLQGGASGCYKNFKSWHRSALFVLLLSGVDPRRDNFFDTEESRLVDPALWRETNQLPANFLEEMNGFRVDAEHLAWFINEAAIQIKKQGNSQELVEWEDFISMNEKRFNDLSNFIAEDVSPMKKLTC